MHPNVGTHVGEAYRLAQTRGQLRKKNSSARIRRRRSGSASRVKTHKEEGTRPL